MIVLDTHVLIWWTGEQENLSKKATRLLEDEVQLCIPSIAFWEVALLARKGRVRLGMPTADWVGKVLTLPRVVCAPLTAVIAIAAEELSMHSDPADRFIVATAQHLNAPLLSKDRLLRKLTTVKVMW